MESQYKNLWTISPALIRWTDGLRTCSASWVSPQPKVAWLRSVLQTGLILLLGALLMVALIKHLWDKLNGFIVCLYWPDYSLEWLTVLQSWKSLLDWKTVKKRGVDILGRQKFQVSLAKRAQTVLCCRQSFKDVSIEKNLGR